MLLLEASQLKQCDVLRNVEGNLETITGVSYQDRLFVRGETFSKSQRESAIEQTKKIFLEGKGDSLIILAENDVDLVMWIEDKQLKVAPENTKDRIASLKLAHVVANMRNVGGVKIRNRTYHMKDYPYCILGSEAVRWFVHKLNISTDEAIRLGQRLIDEKWLHHVSDSHDFRDEELFYRFYWDED